MKKPPFKPVYRELFGSLRRDEQATTTAFEEYVGGVNNAWRLQHIWNNSYGHNDPWKPVTKEHVFRVNASREGFCDEDIEAFLSL